MNLIEYVKTFAIRGACTCGRCIDAPANPEQHQPDGHTADLMFFKVAMKDGATAEAFKVCVEDEFPHWLDGEEHSYLECGANIGDQGMALMAFGLGKLLDVWELLTPNSIMPSLPDDLKQQMAGSGMITIRKVKGE